MSDGYLDVFILHGMVNGVLVLGRAIDLLWDGASQQDMCTTEITLRWLSNCMV